MALDLTSPLTIIIAALATVIFLIPRSISAASRPSIPRKPFSASITAAAAYARVASPAMSDANGAGAETKRVGIIGGGAAGLAATRAFLRANSLPVGRRSVRFEVTVLEARDCIGGIWKYEDGAGLAKTRPMYRNLRTNLPKELMAFREHPWGGEGSEASYVTHGQVQRYLEDYATKFDLLANVRFGSDVCHLKVLSNGDDGDQQKEEKEGEFDRDAWPQISLEWTEGRSNRSHRQTFDYVCICNGHYALPSSPSLRGLENFSGSVIHAVEYDDPNDFVAQTVLCVGARASGADIAREISLVADRVYLSDSACDGMREFGNVVLMPRTQSVDVDGRVHFSSPGGGGGDREGWTANDVDAIIFCSGYDYSFPFIDKDSNLELAFVPGERRVQPLYEQLWHARYPSLSFIGLPHSVVPFPLFEMQSTAVVSQLSPREGSTSLPSLPDRLAAAECDATSGGPDHPGRVQDTHYLGLHQWDYCRKMARIGGVYDDSMENYISTNKALYNRSGKERKGGVPGGEDLYRETRFRRLDEKQSYEILPSSSHSVLESATKL